MKTKKISKKLLRITLTVGASLILGTLSFSGVFVLWPIPVIGFGALLLSVGYEGEIYSQNIKGALDKLIFKFSYHKHLLATQYLLENDFLSKSLENDACPPFFKVYAEKLALLHQFAHKNLDAASKEKRKLIEKELREMEKWLAWQLFALQDKKKEILSKEEEVVRAWLMAHQQQEWQKRLKQKTRLLHFALAFSILSGAFMMIGTSYLLIGAFATIPLLAAISPAVLPFLIVPLAVIAGAAYVFLTYNALSDFIHNDTMRKWYQNIKEDLKKGVTLRSVLRAITAILLVGVAIGLTICTAGTWWTIVTTTRPLFVWMWKMPPFIMGIINPTIIGLSALVFNLQNTSGSLESLEHALDGIKQYGKKIRDSIKELIQRENIGQIFNLPRIILKLTLSPLRIILFFGHLLSIGVTTDRVPSVPEIISVILNIMSEGFEDFHYFFGKDHDDHHDAKSDHSIKDLLDEHLSADHGHSHDLDLPTTVLRYVFYPIFALAAIWDSVASQFNKKENDRLTFTQAWAKQLGIPVKVHVNIPDEAKPATGWDTQRIIYRIEHYKKKHLSGFSLHKDTVNKDLAALTQLQNSFRSQNIQDYEQISHTNFWQEQINTTKQEVSSSTEQFMQTKLLPLCPQV